MNDLCDAQGFPIRVNVSVKAYKSKDEIIPSLMKFTRRRIGSVEELARLFTDGHTCCNMIQPWAYNDKGLLLPSNRRLLNWQDSQVVVLDIDGNDTGLSLDEIVDRLPHRPHIAYRTMSCADDRDNKFRLVYLTDLIFDDISFRAVWWVLDQELRAATGLTGFVYKDGRVTGSDKQLQCPVQVFHGARPGREALIAGNLPFYNHDALIDNSELFKKGSPLRAVLFPGEKGWRHYREYRPDGYDFLIISSMTDNYYRNKSSWVGRSLHPFRSGQQGDRWSKIRSKEWFYDHIYRRTALPEEDRVPGCNAWFIRDPETFYEMPVFYRNGRVYKTQKGQHRKWHLYRDAVRLMFIKPDIDFTLLVMNLLYRLDRYYEWYNGGDDPLTPSDVTGAAVNAMSVDLSTVMPELLFNPCDKDSVQDVFKEARERGIEVDVPDVYIEWTDEERREWRENRRKSLRALGCVMRGAARRIKTDTALLAVYDRGKPLSWNSANIGDRWPDIPNGIARLRRFCQDYGIDPLSHASRRGRKPLTDKDK